MTTTARIAATKGQAVYTATISANTTFAAFGLTGDERIVVELSDSSGNYYPFTFIDGGGRRLEDLRQIRDDRGLREVLARR